MEAECWWLYASWLRSIFGEKCYQFFIKLNDSLRQPFVPLCITYFSKMVERACLIEND
ncbi:hypothetical protein IEQ34_017796 [Dendrobium chrysotoxum]|uniref:Uncharacterized protein n=1 Tax=Dendrobium chrysotoxum TaxID=161865 RepID=A0AAV7GCF0_DENCH|nr:hypothetical protein IEQ34_017796 [Dendrobium chrysotoxum]